MQAGTSLQGWRQFTIIIPEEYLVMFCFSLSNVPVCLANSMAPLPIEFLG